MGFWLSARREVTGAVRSARYDLHRMTAVRRSARLAKVDTAELNRPYLRLKEPAKPVGQRRLLAKAGVAVVVAGGAAGTYLAVAGALTTLTEQPSAPAVAAPAPPAAQAPSTGTSRPAFPTREGPQQRRRPAEAPVLAAPGPEAAVETQAPRLPERTRAASPSASPSASASASPSTSPSAVTPSPSRSRSKSPEYGQDAASGQSGAGR